MGRTRLLWLEVLDLARRWSRSGRASGEDSAVHDGGGLLRRVCAAHLLGMELHPEDQKALSRWLEAVTISVDPSRSKEVRPFVPEKLWPALTARRPNGPVPEPHETLLSTALVQFLGQWQGVLVTVVSRCHGILRGPAPMLGLPPAWEEEFARRAKIVGLLRTGELHQCPRFVWKERGSRYCSKACSNASFALRKALDEPRYFAAKQERYRARQERQKQTRGRGGAFVYMD